MRRIVLLLLLCCLCSFAFAKGSGGHSSHSGKSSKPSKAKNAKGSSAEKTVHVSGYTRKDGKYVAPYDRRPPGTAESSGIATTGTTGSSSVHTYRHDYLADGIAPHPTVQYDKHGKIKRSHAAKAAFEREHPCPSTGKSSGRCPGYVVDHVKALECGGPDDPSNMQWQSTADGKAKDKTERQCRI